MKLEAALAELKKFKEVMEPGAYAFIMSILNSDEVKDLVEI